MSLPLMVRSARYIFAGTVMRITHSETAGAGKVVHVTFGELAVVRGPHSREQFLLTCANSPIQAGYELPEMRVGGRYIVFAMDLGEPPRYLNPLVGGHQGLFRVLPGTRGSPDTVCTSYGRALTRIDDLLPNAYYVGGFKSGIVSRDTVELQVIQPQDHPNRTYKDAKPAGRIVSAKNVTPVVSYPDTRVTEDQFLARVRELAATQ